MVSVVFSVGLVPGFVRLGHFRSRRGFQKDLSGGHAVVHQLRGIAGLAETKAGGDERDETGAIPGAEMRRLVLVLEIGRGPDLLARRPSREPAASSGWSQKAETPIPAPTQTAPSPPKDKQTHEHDRTSFRANVCLHSCCSYRAQPEMKQSFGCEAFTRRAPDASRSYFMESGRNTCRYVHFIFY